MNSKYIIALIAISSLALTGCTNLFESGEDQGENMNKGVGESMESAIESVEGMSDLEPVIDDSAVEVTDAMMEEVKAMEYMYEGALEPVDGGNGTGVAMALFEDGKYTMMARIENIPDPEDGYFYEGWVVRKSPFNFISTGALEKVDGKWVNTYMSEQDFTDHARYVLTIEPDDGDPAPADHVVEGDMSKKE